VQGARGNPADAGERVEDDQQGGAAMGLISWFKDKFNIGGLKIKIVEVEPITEEKGWVKGKITFATGKPVLGGIAYRLVCETTKGKGPEKKTEKSTISEQRILVGVAMDEAGSKTEDFTFDYDLRNWFEKQGGWLGTASKVAKFAADTLGDKGYQEYFVEAEANIKGVWASPSDRRPVTVTVAR
jgi:hypothetical protein